MDEKKFKTVVADNITKYRKMMKITQLELAEYLNYSDKAVSKWERGESLPDVLVLKEIADYFGITLDTLINDDKEMNYKIGFFSIRKRILIPIISVVLVWIIATVTFMFFGLFQTPFFSNTDGNGNYWLVFLYAVSASFIVLVVFSRLWWNAVTTGVMVTGLIWTLITSVYFSLNGLQIENLWLIYVVGAPLQIAATLLFFLKPQKNKLRGPNNQRKPKKVD